jgi:hypothetical protein
LKDLPSRSLRKQVKGFVQGEVVSVRDMSGQMYSVGIKRNKIVLVPDDEFSFAHENDGEHGHLTWFPT